MKKEGPYLIIDFDSTFIQVEAFDELCKLRYTNENERLRILREVSAITSRGMSGELSITESLKSRLRLLNANQSHLGPLVDVLRDKVSDSFKNNRGFLEQNAGRIFIVSNGFSEFILPVVTEYGIRPANVFANGFEYDENDNIVGFDTKNVLASAKGKVKLVSGLQLQGDIIVIGDGYTDYEIHEAGISTLFYAYTENVSRETVVARAEHVAQGLDQIIGDLSRMHAWKNDSINLNKE